MSILMSYVDTEIHTRHIIYTQQHIIYTSIVAKSDHKKLYHCIEEEEAAHPNNFCTSAARAHLSVSTYSP